MDQMEQDITRLNAELYEWKTKTSDTKLSKDAFNGNNNIFTKQDLDCQIYAHEKSETVASYRPF